MSNYYRFIAFLTAALLPFACTIPPKEQPSGARPEILLESIDGVWQPAIGIERSARPTIPDGQFYRASGPFDVSLRDIPLAGATRPGSQGLEKRGGGRMESPLPDEVMEKLREEARFLRVNPRIWNLSADTASTPSQSDASAGTGFDSIDYNECCGSGGNVPPDPELAAAYAGDGSG